MSPNKDEVVTGSVMIQVLEEFYENKLSHIEELDNEN